MPIQISFVGKPLRAVGALKALDTGVHVHVTRPVFPGHEARSALLTAVRGVVHVHLANVPVQTCGGLEKAVAGSAGEHAPTPLPIHPHSHHKFLHSFGLIRRLLLLVLWRWLASGESSRG